MKQKKTFLVEVTEQSIVLFTKKENIDDWGFVLTYLLNFSCLWGTPCKSICSSGLSCDKKAAIRGGGGVFGGN